MECWASILTLTFGINRTAELSVLRAVRTLPPKEIPWYSFLLEAEWTVGLNNADRRSRSLENFQGSSRDFNLKQAIRVSV